MSGGHNKKLVDEPEDNLVILPRNPNPYRIKPADFPVSLSKMPAHFDRPRQILWEKLLVATNGGNLDVAMIEPTLEIAAEVWHRFQTLTEQIEKEGYSSEKGRHVLLPTLNSTTSQLGSYLNMLGITGLYARTVLESRRKEHDWIGEVIGWGEKGQ